MEIKTLSIDLETKSGYDIGKCGVYKYTESPDFKILLFGVSVNAGEVAVYDLACGDSIPEDILYALVDDKVTKWAFNAAFERISISAYLRKYHPGLMGDEKYLDPASWRCTMILAAYNGLPLSLEKVGSVLGFEEQKLKEGKDLIRYFCVPCKPTKTNGGRTWNLPHHAPEKWAFFKKYNQRDVEVEMQIQKRLLKYMPPDDIWDQYHQDQRINDLGIRIDRTLVEQAIRIDEITKSDIIRRMKELTGLENPNSVQQLKGYLADHGMPTESLGKKDVAEMLKTATGDLAEVLSLRLQLAKSSVKKYQAMQNAVCKDGRCHGMFQFYGANRSGRWAGRLIQLQNLPQNHMEDLADARELVRQGDYEALHERYPSVPNVLSELIRTAFIPRYGCKFIVSDYSAIEARVLSYLAGEKWRSEVFESGGDIYCASASKMFHVPVEKHGRNAHLRQKGKVAELACIAEGQLVLTNHGLIPIERITTDDLLWDGEAWVRHEGVIYKGEHEVITYEGLTATADHLVWVYGEPGPVPFGIAATRGAHLQQFGPQAHVGDDPHPPRSARVYDIRNAGKHHRFTVSGKLVHNCGYGGAVGALKAMGGEAMGLTEDEMQQIVSDWHSSNPHIVDYWWQVDDAVKTAIQLRIPTQVGCVKFIVRNGMLFITLPSGRRLSYVQPRIGLNKFGSESVTYMGIDAKKKWSRIESYGPKFVENIVQAISRDILAYAMQALSDCAIVGHIHDELIIEAPSEASLEDICEVMGRTPPWLPGLVLRADGYETMFYKKD